MRQKPTSRNSGRESRCLTSPLAQRLWAMGGGQLGVLWRLVDGVASASRRHQWSWRGGVPDAVALGSPWRGDAAGQRRESRGNRAEATEQGISNRPAGIAWWRRLSRRRSHQAEISIGDARRRNSSIINGAWAQ